MLQAAFLKDDCPRLGQHGRLTHLYKFTNLDVARMYVHSLKHKGYKVSKCRECNYS